MRRILLLTTAAWAALFTLPAFAQELEPLEEVVITATRLPAIAVETPGARVLDSEVIERRGAVFAADILADLPGLSVTRTGLAGPAQVRIRGASPGKTLVLVDGVPVNDPAEVNGAFDFTGLELGEIDRIEVLSGPQSSLWGSDAIGGVIAFTTREIDGIRTAVEAGSFDTVRGRLSLGIAKVDHAFGAYVSRYATDGVSAADEADGNVEADGLDSTAAGARGRIQLASGVEAEASVRWYRTRADIDGFPAPSYALADTDDTSQTDQASGFGRLTVAALGLVHRFSVSGSRTDRETISDFPSTFEAERRVWRWQANRSAVGHRVDLAFGAEREDVEGSVSSGDIEELGTTSVFATGRLQATDRLSLTGALRWDDTDDFGAEATGRASAAYALGGGFVLSGAYGTGFKAPSLSQAVCDFCFSSTPYPELRPETAEGYEAALGWVSADRRLDGRITLYRLKVEDQISYVTDPGTFDSVYVNIDETSTDGVELEGRAILGGGFDLSLAYAWADARDGSDGSRLPRVPEHTASATLGWTGGRLSGAVTLRSESDQRDSGGVRDGFVVANLAGAWRIAERVELFSRVENLTDERYQQVLGYGEPGRSGYVGIRLRY